MTYGIIQRFAWKDDDLIAQRIELEEWIQYLQKNSDLTVWVSGKVIDVSKVNAFELNTDPWNFAAVWVAEGDVDEEFDIYYNQKHGELEVNPGSGFKLMTLLHRLASAFNAVASTDGPVLCNYDSSLPVKVGDSI